MSAETVARTITLVEAVVALPQLVLLGEHAGHSTGTKAPTLSAEAAKTSESRRLQIDRWVGEESVSESASKDSRQACSLSAWGSQTALRHRPHRRIGSASEDAQSTERGETTRARHAGSLAAIAGGSLSCRTSA